MDDEFLDSLPPHLRNQLLEAVEVDADGNLVKHKSNKRPKLLWWLIPIFLFWSFPLLIIGALLCVTIIGISIGVPLIFLGFWPVAVIFGKAMGA